MSNYVRAVEFAFQLAMRCPTNLVNDRTELAAKKLPYERLDQLTVDILFGVR